MKEKDKNFIAKGGNGKKDGNNCLSWSEIVVLILDKSKSLGLME